MSNKKKNNNDDCIMFKRIFYIETACIELFSKRFRDCKLNEYEKLLESFKNEMFVKKIGLNNDVVLKDIINFLSDL